MPSLKCAPRGGCVQVRAKQLDIAGVEEQMAKLDSMLKEARGQTEKVQKEYNTMSEKVGTDTGCLGWRHRAAGYRPFLFGLPAWCSITVTH